MSAQAEFATHWGIGTLLPGDGPADRYGLARDLVARLPGRPRLIAVYEFLKTNGDDVARCIAHFAELAAAREARLAARAEPAPVEPPARATIALQVESYRDGVLRFREGGLALIDPPRSLFPDGPPVPGDRLVIHPGGWLAICPRERFEAGLLPLDQ